MNMFLRKSHHMDPYFVYLLRMISLCLSGKKKWRFCLSNMDVIRAPFKHINWIYTILSVYFYISLSKKNIGSRKIYMYNFLKFFGVLDWHAPTQTCLNEGASWAGVGTLGLAIIKPKGCWVWYICQTQVLLSLTLVSDAKPSGLVGCAARPTRQT